MADWGRSSGGSRGRGGTWDAAERRRRALAWAGAWTDGLPGFGRLAEQLRNWAIADTGPGRLLPWLGGAPRSPAPGLLLPGVPLAFGLGIAIYFTAKREPAWWAAGLAASGCAIAFIARRRP